VVPRRACALASAWLVSLVGRLILRLCTLLLTSARLAPLRGLTPGRLLTTLNRVFRLSLLPYTPARLVSLARRLILRLCTLLLTSARLVSARLTPLRGLTPGRLLTTLNRLFRLVVLRFV
jgi:hypothetical protein